MKLIRGFLVAGVCLVGALGAPDALARGPSTPAERTKVVHLTRLLERDPLHGDAAAAREWLNVWIREVPDVRVSVCADLLGPALGDAYPYSDVVNPQMAFSAAAFAIEHPNRARDDVAQYRAGVEGSLRVYEVLLKSRPDARSPLLDDLLAKRDRGALGEHVATQAKEKCKRPNIELIASVIGAGVGLLLGLIVAWRFHGRRTAVARTDESARTARVAHRVVVVSAAYYAIVVAALHVLEPEFDPRFRFVSEYVWGPYGWLAVTTFVALALALFAVAAALRHLSPPQRSARIGFGLLVVGGVFVFLAGVFREFIPHLAASAVAIPSVVMGTLSLSWSFRRATGWGDVHGYTLLISLGMLAAFLGMMVGFGMPGLYQRAFLGLLLLWLMIVASRLVRLTGRTASG